MMKSKKFWLVVTLILLAGLTYRVLSTREKPVQYKPVKVTRRAIRTFVTATGVVQPQNRLEIKPPIAGRVDEVLVREGDKVRKGQVLAWMSSGERAALLDVARAKGSAELAHWEELYKPTPLIAALSGEIILRGVEPGQTVTTQDAILVMSDRLIIKAQVDETDIGKISKKQPVSLTLDAYPVEDISAQVDHIAFEAKTVNNVTIYEVDVLPASVPPFMKSGMTANLSFLIEEKINALALPADAVQQDEDSAMVLRPTGSDKPKTRLHPVEMGLSDGRHVEIISGLNEGDEVLVVDLPKVKSKSRGTNPLSPMRRRPSSTTNRQSSQSRSAH